MIKFFSIVFLFFCISILGQNDSLYMLDDYLSLLATERNFDENDDILINQIEELLADPIDLNSEDISKLLTLPFLSTEQIYSILEYRKENKKFFSTHELRNIEGLNYSTIRLILPLITVSKVQAIPSENKVKRSYTDVKLFMRNRIQQKGNDLGENLFSPNNKLYNRLKIIFNNYQIGITTEKDFNENSFFDYHSFYLQSENMLVDKVILGDFLVYYGNGLALWSPYRIYKTAVSVTNAVKSKNYISPYQSTDENKFYRGIAIQHNFDFFNFTVFYSLNYIDGKIDSLSNEFHFTLDGQHSTKIGILQKDKIKNVSFGTLVGFNLLKNFSVNFLFYDNLFQFSDSHLKEEIFSTAYRLKLSQLLIFGENAFLNGNIKSINNLNFTITKNLGLIFSYRNYSNNAKSFLGNGFGESSKHVGEIGFYSGIDFTNSFAEMSFYFDQYKIIDERKFDFELLGKEFMFNFTKPFMNKLRFSFYTIFEIKETFMSQLDSSKNEQSSRFRLDLTYLISKNLSNKSRVEFANVSSKESKKINKGFLVYNELKAKMFSDKLKLSCRLTFFRTTSYDSRIYTFENDLPGLMTVMPFYNDGFKWYVLISYTPTTHLILSIKISELYKDTPFIVDSDSLPFGDSIKSINLQMDMNF